MGMLVHVGCAECENVDELMLVIISVCTYIL